MMSEYLRAVAVASFIGSTGFLMTIAVMTDDLITSILSFGLLLGIVSIISTILIVLLHLQEMEEIRKDREQELKQILNEGNDAES